MKRTKQTISGSNANPGTVLMQGVINYDVNVNKSRIHGKGVYAVCSIPAKRKIGSLGGSIISKRKARMKASGESIAIVELWNGKALDASVNGNAFRYINHSCSPNTYMRNIGNHVELYASRSICAKEELTCSYGATRHDGKRECSCGAKNCKGFI